MLKKKLLVTALASTMTLPAWADESPITANVSLTTNYLYRGISQTGNGPALQGGFDYAHESGVYAGAWGSSISWLGDFGTASNAGLEVDTYFGYAGSASDIGYDIGFLRYNYPGNYGTNLSADTDEIYGKISYQWVSLKYSYSLSNLFGVANSKGSGYLDLSASYTLEEMGVSLAAHYGKQTVANNSASDYSDYSLSVTKGFAGLDFSLMYSSTDLKNYLDPQGNDLGKGQVVLSVKRTM